jgi:hypothetical protein
MGRLRAGGGGGGACTYRMRIGCIEPLFLGPRQALGIRGVIWGLGGGGGCASCLQMRRALWQRLQTTVHASQQNTCEFSHIHGVLDV